MSDKYKFREIIKRDDEKNITEEELTEVLKVCYKKLKSYVYHDNTNLFIRNQIAKYEYESIEKYEKEIKKLREENKKVDPNYDILTPNLSELSKKIINGEIENVEKINVGYYCLPKSVEVKEKPSLNEIRNFPTSKNYSINKATYFIDINIEYHILGVLWIMLFGKELEGKYGRYTYGNKLDDKFEYDNIKLFKPYFEEYQKWRDKGINSVEKMMEEKKRCLMITLDIKDYFYTANVDFNKLQEDLSLSKDTNNKKYKENQIKKTDLLRYELKNTCNNVIRIIMEKYTNIIKNKDTKTGEQDKEYILPIGFTPSYIICNWYLHNFDNDIIKSLNPIYYGRYIDDITIVIPIHLEDKQNEDYREILFERFHKKGILDYAIQKNQTLQFTENIDDVFIKLDNDNFEDIKAVVSNIPRREFKLKEKVVKFIGDYIDKVDEALEEIKRLKGEGSNNDEEPYEYIDIVSKLKHYYKDSKDEIIYKDWRNKGLKELLELLKPVYNYKGFEDITLNTIKKIYMNLEFEYNEAKKVYLISDYYKQNARNTKKHLATLCIQEAKVKVYDFKAEGSSALLNNFKKNLRQTTSAFNLLPEKSNIITNFDNEVYKIDYSGSINKLSSIDNFEVDKYGISKFLAQVIYSDKLENNQDISDVEEKILCLFKDNTCIELYGLWEKVMMYYLINNRHDHILKFIKEVIKSINELECKMDEFSIYRGFKMDKEIVDNDVLDRVKNSLIKHLSICISMVYSLNDELIDIKDEYKEGSIFNYVKYSEELNENKIIKNKEQIRKSNMIRHSVVRENLMNYTICVTKNDSNKSINLIEDRYSNLDIRSDLRCSKLNKNYKDRYGCSSSNKHSSCVFNINYDYAKYSPRFVHLHELILYNISLNISRGKIIHKGRYIEKAIDDVKEINNIELVSDYNDIYSYVHENDEESDAVRKYKFSKNDYLLTQKESHINIIDVKTKTKLDKLKLGIVNMKVNSDDIDLSFYKTPNLHSSRIQNISHLLNEAVKNKANMVIFPEVSIPYQWLNSISRFASKHNIAIVCGLEHIVYENGLCCNYLATILPGEHKDYYHAVVKLRLKNHYSPREKEYVKGFNWELPEMKSKYESFKHNNDEFKQCKECKYKKTSNSDEDKKNEDSKVDKCEKCEHNKKIMPNECELCKSDIKGIFEKEYDLIKWSGVDFSSYSCFELADIKDRALFTSHVDLLVGSIHNKDLNYYSNIIESLSRDVHCYFAQVNNSELGDNRVISPSKSVKKNILQITGGDNDLVLIAEIDIKSLRDFQKKAHNLQVQDDRFKPVPPGFDYNNVKVRDEMPL